MRIYTRIEIDILTGELISSESYDYNGPIEHLGGDSKSKGKANTSAGAAGAGNVANTATQTANSDTGIQAGYRKTGDAFANNLIPDSQGHLSPYAGAQFAQEKKQIGKTYGDMSDVGLRQLGTRGLAAPGASASIINTNNRNAGEAETNAYERAQQASLGQGLAGIGYGQTQQQIYNPNAPLSVASGAYGTQGNLGVQQANQGSPLGAIGTILGMGAQGVAMA